MMFSSKELGFTVCLGARVNMLTLAIRLNFWGNHGNKDNSFQSNQT